MRVTKIGISTLAAAGLMLAGCSSGDDGTTPSASSSSSDSAPADSPEEASDDGGGEASDDLVRWAANLCTAVGPFEERFTSFEGAAPTDPSDASAYVEQLVETFGSMGSIFTDARDAIEAEGPPPIEGGDEVQADLLAALQTAGAAFDQIGTELAGIDPEDPNAMSEVGAVLQNIAPAMDESVTSLDTAFSQPEMEAAFAAAPECEGVTGS